MKYSWSSEETADVAILEKVQSLEKEINKLRIQNNKLTHMLAKIEANPKKSFINELNSNKLLLNNDCPNYTIASEPTMNQEYLRRRVESEVREFGYYLTAELKGLKSKAQINQDDLKGFYIRAEEQHRYLLASAERYSEEGILAWQTKALDDLADEVKKRIEILQNPKDCKTHPKAFCSMGKGCGYGCVVHHVLFCFTTAYATGRTLVLDPQLYRYSNTHWTDNFLLPSSKCLFSKTEESAAYRGSLTGDAWFSSKDIVIPILDSLRGNPAAFFPQAVPKDLAERISHLHGAPFAWFIGQLLHYLTRPNENLQSEINQRLEKVNIIHGKSVQPIVGVHVRRTDKVGTEAKFHDLQEYMEHVEDWFKLQEVKRLPLHPKLGDKLIPLERRVYLATDQPSLLDEAKQKYPNYIFYSDVSLASAASLGTRYSNSGLKSIVIDTFMLAHTDHLVCTFSSQVCRIAYEYMQTRHSALGDASSRFYSLDDIYYFGGQQDRHMRAIYPHQVPPHATLASPEFAETNLNIGDLVGIAGNHWNGFSVGQTGSHSGLVKFPTYKMEFVLNEAPMFVPANDSSVQL